MNFLFEIVQEFVDPGATSEERIGWDMVRGEYDSVSVYLNGELLITYGDYYHEKGHIAANAFVAGFMNAMNRSSGKSLDFVVRDLYAIIPPS